MITRQDDELDRSVVGFVETQVSADDGELPLHSSDAIATDEEPNVDEVDARMSEIVLILDHAAMRLLDKCALVAEWVGHTENRASVFRQLVQKPQGGRPEGGIARAARELPIPGKSIGGRRKFIERAITINGMWPEVKSAVRAGRLDGNQTALLAIAGERSLEAQLGKVHEIVARKAAPRRKSRARDGDESTKSSKAPSTTSRVAAPHTLDQQPEPPSKHEIDESKSTIKPELDQSKPASIAALIEFAKFMLMHIKQGEEAILTLTATEEVAEFNRLANRARLVLARINHS
jgi:hypothetical protein